MNDHAGPSPPGRAARRNGASSCTGPRISRRCARPARSPPSCSTSSRPMSSRASPPTSSTGSATASPSITAAISAPLNYRGFPRSICTSINHVVCHGIPGDRKLIEGDIVNIDVTADPRWLARRFAAACSWSATRIPVKARRLVEVTYEAMMRGIAAVRPGAPSRRYRPRHPELTPRRSASPWCAISAATASAASSTTRRRSCISAGPARGRSCARACSSPSSR